VSVRADTPSALAHGVLARPSIARRRDVARRRWSLRCTASGTMPARALCLTLAVAALTACGEQAHFNLRLRATPPPPRAASAAPSAPALPACPCPPAADRALVARRAG